MGNKINRWNTDWQNIVIAAIQKYKSVQMRIYLEHYYIISVSVHRLVSMALDPLEIASKMQATRHQFKHHYSAYFHII